MCIRDRAIGVDPAYIVASAPACYGYYILPTYPSDLAAIQFDRSGTTHICLLYTSRNWNP